MNTAEIASRFIRAAEIDRSTREHVGPAPLRAQQLPYTHDWIDKAGWRKEVGDKLDPKADLLADERRRFWEDGDAAPTAEKLSAVQATFDWLTLLDNDGERRALLAWARSKVGGKSFRRWCHAVEGIHPETGRRRKDRALAKIEAEVIRRAMQNDGSREIRVLLPEAEIDDISDTLAEDARAAEPGLTGLNSWAAPDTFQPFIVVEEIDRHGLPRRTIPTDQAAFSWARKRNEARRQREKRKRAA